MLQAKADLPDLFLVVDSASLRLNAAFFHNDVRTRNTWANAITMKTKGNLTPTNMSASDTAAASSSPQPSPRLPMPHRTSKLLDRLGANMGNGTLESTAAEYGLLCEPMGTRNISASNLMALSQGQLELKVYFQRTAEVNHEIYGSSQLCLNHIPGGQLT